MDNPGRRLRRESAATVSLDEITSTDLEGFLDLIAGRAFGDDGHHATDLAYSIVGHTACAVTLAVTAVLSPD